MATIYKYLLIFLIFISSYDKSGITIKISDRYSVVGYYKIILIIFIINFLLIYLGRKKIIEPIVNNKTIIITIVFIFGLTLLSFLGTLFISQKLFEISNIYYLISRLSLIIIPVYAYIHKIRPQKILEIFLLSIVFHDLFILLQFLSPNLYISIVSVISNLPDNALIEWNKKSLAFIGLSRTSNYGSFVSTIGIISVAFIGGSNKYKKILYSIVFSFSIVAAFFGGARAVLVLFIVTIIVLIIKYRLFKKIYFILIMLLSVFLFSQTLNYQDINSINRIFSIDAEGSNKGHLLVTEYAFNIIEMSPYIGWGHTKFVDISYRFGNYLLSTSETHSFILSTMVSTGIIGLIFYIFYFFYIIKRLFACTNRFTIITFATFIGLGFYNIFYDAGGLDFYYCFLGVVTYFAMSENLSKQDVIL